jgi:hypothetical protein
VALLLKGFSQLQLDSGWEFGVLGEDARKAELQVTDDRYQGQVGDGVVVAVS